MDQNVRQATPDDLADLLKWSGRFAVLANVDADMADVGHTLLDLMESPSGLVALHGSGFIAAEVSPAWFNTSTLIAQEVMWWADGGGMALLRYFEAWAGERADATVVAHVLDNGPRLDRIFRRRGYRPSDQKYIRSR